MAHPRLKPAKPVDGVAYEPLMLQLSKARAMAHVLAEVGNDDTDLAHALSRAPAETRAWLHGVVADALNAAHDEIEREYRKLGTNLLDKEAAALAEPKDGA